MTISETRKMFQTIPGTSGGLAGVHSGQIGGRWVDQTAIPWCTAHDYQAMSDVIGCPADYRGLDESCEISTDGPDHKWWKDIE